MTLAQLLALLEPILLFCLAIGGYIGLRSGLAKTTRELEERVKQAMREENELLQKRLGRLEEENAHLQAVLRTIQYTLKERRKLKLEVKDDFVMLTDEQTGSEITMPIRLPGSLEKEG